MNERLRKLRAAITGYFWLPCPRCGRMFGGYEEGGTIWTAGGMGRMTCKNCPDDYYPPDTVVLRKQVRSRTR